ncbi:MAG: hypothetical protein ACLFQ3_06650 [Thiohalorhabdus sp.]
MGYGDHVKAAFHAMLQTLGVDASIGGTSIRGVWANDYYRAEAGEVAFSGTRPRFVCKEQDFADAGGTVGSVISIEGTDYTVRDPQPDTWGTLVLELSED